MNKNEESYEDYEEVTDDIDNDDNMVITEVIQNENGSYKQVEPIKPKLSEREIRMSHPLPYNESGAKKFDAMKRAIKKYQSVRKSIIVLKTTSAKLEALKVKYNAQSWDALFAILIELEATKVAA